MVGSWERTYGAPAAAAAALTADGACRRVYGDADGGGGNGSEADEAMSSEEASGERLARDMWLYGGTTLVACGTVGYALLLSVAACSRRARSLRCAAFVVALSLAGLARLYTGLLSTLVRHQTCHRVAFAAIASDVGCRLGAAAHYLAAQAYAWMQACLAADGLHSDGGAGANAVQIKVATRTTAARRVCCSCSGGRGRGCRVPPVAIVAGALVLLACIDAVPFVAYGQDADGLCAPLQAALAASWRHAHFVLYFVLPATAIVASHVAVCWRCRSGGRHSNGSDVRGVDEKQAVGRESALEAATLALNVTFVLTAAPDAFISLITPDDSGDGTVELIRCACGLLVYAGCAAPFALCAVVGLKYRKALETTGRASPKSDDAQRCDCDHCVSGGNDVRNEQQQQQSRSLALHACCLCCRHAGGGGNNSDERMQHRPANGPPAAAASVSDSVC